MYSGSRLNLSEVNPTYQDQGILTAKQHEPQAQAVEGRLRHIFRRHTLHVLPAAAGLNHDELRLNIYDSAHPQNNPSNKILQTAHREAQSIYSGIEVDIRGDDIRDENLNLIVDHILALKYGHDHYRTEVFQSIPCLPFYEIDLRSNFGRASACSASIIDKIQDDPNRLCDDPTVDYYPEIPDLVAQDAIKIAKMLRPRLYFRIPISQKIDDNPPVYARGFTAEP